MKYFQCLLVATLIFMGFSSCNSKEDNKLTKDAQLVEKAKNILLGRQKKKHSDGGDFGRAYKLLKEAIKINPNNEEAKNNIYQIEETYKRLGKQIPGVDENT